MPRSPQTGQLLREILRVNKALIEQNSLGSQAVDGRRDRSARAVGAHQSGPQTFDNDHYTII